MRDYISIPDAGVAIYTIPERILFDIGNIISKYNLQGKIAIWLPHRHYAISSDEIVLRKDNIQKPIRADIAGKVYPYNILINDDGIDVMEYSSISGTEIKDDDFVKEFRDYLAQRDMLDKVGLSLNHFDAEHEVNGPGKVSVYTNPVVKVNKLIDTTWGVELKLGKSSLIPGQRTCEIRCSGGNGNGQPIHDCTD